MKTHKCTWTESEDEPIETDCGNAFEFTEGGIKENGFVYCPYCGGEIVQRFEGEDNAAL